MGRLKNRVLAKLFTRFPGIFKLEKYAEKAVPLEIEGTPWTDFTGKLHESTVAIVTTAGVHLKGQKPFDMQDPDGDPSYRELPSDTPREDYTITHDYYDHKDADADLNIVYPIDRLEEFVAEGLIGGLAPKNYGFMGHIDGPHIKTLIEKTAPEVAAKLKDQGVDVVILTPG